MITAGYSIARLQCLLQYKLRQGTGGAMIETHKSIVSSTECDANEHLNVGHYVQRFSEAGQNLFSMYGAGETWYRPVSRHFRFHREVTDNSRTIVNSVRIGAGDHAGQILHVMQDASRNFVSATCLDTDFAAALKGLPETRGGPTAKAKPRSIPKGPFVPADTDRLLENRMAIVTHRNRVHGNECDGDDCMADSELVGRFFAAASQLWAYVGFDMTWFVENGYGGAAVEMKLTVHEEIKSGQDYAILSWVPRMSAKMLALSNQMVTVPENRPLASISATSVVMDHKTRMAVEIPGTFRKKYVARFAEIGEMATF